MSMETAKSSLSKRQDGLSVRGYQTGKKTDKGRQVEEKQVGRVARQVATGRCVAASQTTSPASQHARGPVGARLTNTAAVWAWHGTAGNH